MKFKKKPYFIVRKKKTFINEGIRKINNVDEYKNDLKMFIKFVVRDVNKFNEDTIINEKYSYKLSVPIDNIINEIVLNIINSKRSDKVNIIRIASSYYNGKIFININFITDALSLEEYLYDNLLTEISKNYFNLKIKNKRTIKDTNSIINYDSNRFNLNSASLQELVECVLYGLKRSTLNSADIQIITYLTNNISDIELLIVSDSKIKDMFEDVKANTRVYKLIYDYPLKALNRLSKISDKEKQNFVIQEIEKVYSNIKYNSYDDVIQYLRNKIERNNGRIEEHIRRYLGLN